jgi:hypothetical protein
MVELYPGMYQDHKTVQISRNLGYSVIVRARSAFFNLFKLALRKFTTKKSILRDKAKVTEIVRVLSPESRHNDDRPRDDDDDVTSTDASKEDEQRVDEEIVS